MFDVLNDMRHNLLEGSTTFFWANAICRAFFCVIGLDSLLEQIFYTSYV